MNCNDKEVNKQNLNVTSVASFMIFVFTEDILLGYYQPTSFKSWEDVYSWTFNQNCQRRKNQTPNYFQTSPKDILERMMMWKIVRS